MPIFPLKDYKDMIQVTSNSQDSLFELLASGAEDYVARFCAFRISNEANLVPIEESVWCRSGIMRPKARPIIEVVSINGSASGFDVSRQFIEGDFSDGYHDIVYYAGYTPQTLPRGLRIAMLEVFKVYHDSRDNDNVDMSRINIYLHPYKFATGVA